MDVKYQKFTKDLSSKGINYLTDEPMSRHTTWKIGGPADIFIECKTVETIKSVYEQAKVFEIPVTIVGSGSNILVADEGIRGVVVKSTFDNLEVLDQKSDIAFKENINQSDESNSQKIQARLEQLETEKYYSFDDLNFNESESPRIRVKVGSGYYLPKLINQLIEKGITGLQWFSGIPGTIGGAVYNNIHGGSYFISQFVQGVDVMNPQDFTVKHLTSSDLQFDYDKSYFHSSNEFITNVYLNLYLGDRSKAAKAAMAWAQKKRLQPYNSAGCCFRNIDKSVAERLKIPSCSWGHIIEHNLGLKGLQIGNAQISTKHAAFVENLGGATAHDVLRLFDAIYDKSRSVLGIQPELEIFLVGFSPEVKSKYL